jgi:PAS domain S-box-containing protein
MGAGVAALAIVPVGICAWFWGLRGGLAASLLAFPADMFLLNLFGYQGGGWGVITHGGVGSAVLVLIGVVIGRLRDLREELKRQLAERKQAEEALRESEQKYRTLLEGMNEGLLQVDNDDVVQFANDRFCEMVGYRRDELLGRVASELLLMDKDSDFMREKNRLRTQKISDRYEIQLKKKSGDVIWVQIGGAPIIDANGAVLGSIGIHTDITERKRAERILLSYQDKLRSLASQLSLAEEHERQRIAAKLHDRIGQTLAFCNIKLGALQKSASAANLREPIDEIRTLIEGTIQDTRSLTFELSPPVLHELGFEAAVEWLGEQIQKQHRVAFEIENDGDPKPLDEDVRFLLFRAASELLVNVAKHAAAHSVKVSIRRDGNDIRVAVKDDGVGFDASENGLRWNGAKGFGLFSIRERLGYVGGHLEIESQPGCGTRATLVAPLRV